MKRRRNVHSRAGNVTACEQQTAAQISLGASPTVLAIMAHPLLACHALRKSNTRSRCPQQPLQAPARRRGPLWRLLSLEKRRDQRRARALTPASARPPHANSTLTLQPQASVCSAAWRLRSRSWKAVRSFTYSATNASTPPPWPAAKRSRLRPRAPRVSARPPSTRAGAPPGMKWQVKGRRGRAQRVAGGLGRVGARGERGRQRGRPQLRQHRRLPARQRVERLLGRRVLGRPARGGAPSLRDTRGRALAAEPLHGRVRRPAQARSSTQHTTLASASTGAGSTAYMKRLTA